MNTAERQARWQELFGRLRAILAGWDDGDALPGELAALCLDLLEELSERNLELARRER